MNTKVVLNYLVEYKQDTYDASVEVEFHVEKDYGADADGHRGTGILIIDDAKVLSVKRFEVIAPDDNLIDEILKQVNDRLCN